MSSHFLPPSRPNFDKFFATEGKHLKHHRRFFVRALPLLSSRSIASVGLVLCLLSTSTPAAPQTIVTVSTETATSLAFWYQASGFSKLFQGNGNAKGQEKQADRDGRVTRIQIFPADATVDLSDHVKFVAIAYDEEGNSVGGVKIRWSGQGAKPNQKARVSQHGEFEATRPGSFTIKASAAGKSAETTVTVRATPRRDLNATPTGSHQVSSRDLPPSQTRAAEKKIKIQDKTSQVKSAEVASTLTKRAHSKSPGTAAAPEPVPQGGGGGWGDSNYWSADDPGNRVGDPPGSSPDGGGGSGNFQFAAPILSLPGRGINISLGLAYNSRVWNKANTQISFDNDRGWPSPGFNLGFGKMLGMGVYNGAMLVDADGTRHSYGGNITFFSWGTHGIMHTTDGSFIDYEYWTGTGGSMTWGTARLPNGTVISFGASSGHLYPVSIEDANGNFIGISYVNNIGPRIQAISDTLNRTVSFYYDSNNLLTAITGPV